MSTLDLAFEEGILDEVFDKSDDFAVHRYNLRWVRAGVSGTKAGVEKFGEVSRTDLRCATKLDELRFLHFGEVVSQCDCV